MESEFNIDKEEEADNVQVIEWNMSVMFKED